MYNLKYQTCLALLTLCLCSYICKAQLNLRITQIPSYTPSGAIIYVAGNFNNWNPSNSPLTLQTDGSYTITITPPISLVEFKFTRGSWNSVEGNENGDFLPNRTFNYNGTAQTINNIQIASWEDLATGSACIPTANSQVSDMSTEFYMPQLDRYRHIRVYLPNDYTNSPNKHYPVLYMQDAQNLFDQCDSFSGEWQIDETLYNLQNTAGNYGAIVVGIDNGGALRLNEYSPWVNAQYGGGEGDEYVNFIIQTLKPYIDEQYRTLPEREFTGIMGSSMGGLISFYAALQNQNTFGCAGIFSPSFWFSNEVIEFAQNNPKQQDMRIYFLAGGLEGTTMVSQMQEMYNLLLNDTGFTSNDLHYKVVPNGQHSEWFWASEFAEAYNWLYSNTTLANITPTNEQTLQIKFIPSDSIILIENIEKNLPYTLYFYDAQGKLCLNQVVYPNKKINLSQLPTGLYLVRIGLNGQTIYSSKFVR